MPATKTVLLMLASAVAAVALAAAPAAAQTCAGDCTGDRAVTVDEIILGVRIALGSAATAECLALDTDSDGSIAINELLAAVNSAIDGCGAAPTGTATGDLGPTATTTPAPTNTAVPTAADPVALAAARVATDPIFRFFELQESIASATFVAARARRTAHGASGGVSGCQQLTCDLSGTLDVCCSATSLIQTFDRCAFDDGFGLEMLTGQLVIEGDTATICAGGIPGGISVDVVLDGLTHDITLEDGRFSRTFQQLSERFDAAPLQCTVSEPDFFGFDLRGSGERLLNGRVQRLQLDGDGALLLDSEIEVGLLRIAVGATENEPEGCRATAALTGSLAHAHFRLGEQSAVEFDNFQVIQDSGSTTLTLELSGTLGSDCVGDVALSTVAPLRITHGDACFTAGSLEAQSGSDTVAASYTATGGVDLDFGADGSVEQRFGVCRDVPAEQCSADSVPLCGACTAPEQCHRGLGCFPCSDDCSGETARCALFGAFVTCEDGVF